MKHKFNNLEKNTKEIVTNSIFHLINKDQKKMLTNYLAL